MLHLSRTQEMPTDGASLYSIINLVTRPKLPYFFLSALPSQITCPQQKVMIAASAPSQSAGKSRVMIR
jgi:hypothetical protein